MIRSRAAAVAAIALLVVPTASGCYQNLENTVSVQGPTGNAVDLTVGDLLVQDTTLVAGPGGRAASLIFTIINSGDQADALTQATVSGTRATIATAPIIVTPGSAVQVGGPSTHRVVVTGLDVPAGSWADVKLAFRDAGSVSSQVFIVNAEGYYEGWGPAGIEDSVDAG